MACWNRWAREAGFDGIYFVKTDDAHTSESLGQFNATYRREPFYTFSKGASKPEFLARVIRTRGAAILNKGLNKMGKGIVGYTYDYDKIWRKLISRRDIGPTVIPGAFAGWDNTARKQYNAQILTGSDPEKFGRYFGELLGICRERDVPFLVINAWNEWAEGAYLEPDEKYAFNYLEKIKEQNLRDE